MARTPSCYLHMGFFLHLCAFSALLAGYCTPYWTLVKLSTGDVKALGVVVSCHKRGCDLLHVTGARMVFIIIFGMSTGAVVLSFFILQCFCLSLYNGSCMVKNLGAGLSYLSVFIACTLGATLTLYQIDLTEEDKPGVMWMSIGWSRYAVIGSAGGYLLGAFCNVADFTRRNRLNKMDVVKKAEARSRMISIMERNRQKGGGGGGGSGETTGGAGNAGSNFQGKRMSLTVDAAVKMASQRKNLERQLKSSNPGPSTSSKPAGVILVNEASERFRGTSKNSRSGGNDVTGRRDPQQQQQQQQRSKVQPQSEAQRKLAMDVIRKSKLTKSSHVDSNDGRPRLPSVEEEHEHDHIPDDGSRLRERSKVNTLRRHDTTSLRVSDKIGTSHSTSVPTSNRSGADSTKDRPKVATVDSEIGDSSVKYKVTPEADNTHKTSSHSKHEKGEQIRNKTSALHPPSSSDRRGSAVEDAIANISSFLGTMGKSGAPTSTTKISFDSEAESPRIPRALPKRNVDILSLRSETSVDGGLEKPRDLPPISHRRRLTSDESFDYPRRSSIKRQVTVDSEKADIYSLGYDNSNNVITPLKDVENFKNFGRGESVSNTDRDKLRDERNAGGFRDREKDLYNRDSLILREKNDNQISTVSRDRGSSVRNGYPELSVDSRDRRGSVEKRDSRVTEEMRTNRMDDMRRETDVSRERKDKERSRTCADRDVSLKNKRDERSVESAYESCQNNSSSNNNKKKSSVNSNNNSNSNYKNDSVNSSNNDKSNSNSHSNSNNNGNNSSSNNNNDHDNNNSSCDNPDASSRPERNPLETQLTEEQIKRRQIVENIAKNRESKEKRRKRITQ